MSQVERLRRLAAARAKPLRYPICLDREKQRAVDMAVEHLESLHMTRANLAPDAVSASLSSRSPQDLIDARIVEATTALELAEADAAADSVILMFRWLDPDERDDLMGDVAPEGKLSRVYRTIAATTYERTEASDGEDVGWDFAEAWKVTNSGDRQRVYVALVDHDLEAQTLPFDPANSGRPA